MIENRLKEFVRRAEGEGIVLRSLECRTTRCAMEVESPHSHFLGETEKDPDLAGELLPGMGALGFETGPQGEKLVVIILTYFRL